MSVNTLGCQWEVLGGAQRGFLKEGTACSKNTGKSGEYEDLKGEQSVCGRRDQNEKE